MNYLIKHFQILAMIVITLSCASCSSENEDEPNVAFPDYDIEFHFNVVDEQGNNLMDSSNPNNILGQDIYITYEGHKYPLTNYKETLDKFPSGEADYSPFYGIYHVSEYQQEFANNEPFIYVGKFVLPVWSKHKFTIHWGDNFADDTFEFCKDPRTVINGEVTYLTTTWLNGKIYRDVTEFTIVKTSI